MSMSSTMIQTFKVTHGFLQSNTQNKTSKETMIQLSPSRQVIPIPTRSVQATVHEARRSMALFSPIQSGGRWSKLSTGKSALRSCAADHPPTFFPISKVLTLKSLHLFKLEIRGLNITKSSKLRLQNDMLHAGNHQNSIEQCNCTGLTLIAQTDPHTQVQTSALIHL